MQALLNDILSWLTKSVQLTSSSLTKLSEDLLLWLSKPTDNLGILVTALITVLIAFATIYLTGKHQRQLSRREKTSEFLNDFATNGRYHTDAVCISHYFQQQQKRLPISLLYQELTNGKAPKEVTLAIRDNLNLWERLAIGCRQGVYDGEVLYDNYATHFISFYKKLKPYIDSKRQQFPRIYLNAEWLAISWIYRRELNQDKHQKLIKHFTVQANLVEAAKLTNNKKEMLKIYKNAYKTTNKIINKIYR